MIRVLFLISILLSQSIFATVVTEFDTMELVKCTFSRDHHNRVVVEGGRITTVVVPEGDVAARVEAISGQLFVHALHPNPSVTTISIVTESGEIQDIELSFEEKSSETLVLEPKKEVNLCCQNESSSQRQELRISKVVNEILCGRAPCGYFVAPKHNENRSIRRCLTAERICKYASDCEALYVWKVKNRSRSVKRVCREDFSFMCPTWVYIQNDQIKPSKQTIVIVGVNFG